MLETVFEKCMRTIDFLKMHQLLKKTTCFRLRTLTQSISALKFKVKYIYANILQKCAGKGEEKCWKSACVPSLFPKMHRLSTETTCFRLQTLVQSIGIPKYSRKVRKSRGKVHMFLRFSQKCMDCRRK